MFQNLMFSFQSYCAFYSRYYTNQWSNMTPLKYGTLLIGVGVFGWLLMKSGNKRE